MPNREKKTDEARAVGRRKTSSARVKISVGKGSVMINNRQMTDYFTLKIWQEKVVSPLVKSGRENKMDVSVKVSGGGVKSQAEAVRHGIARALVDWDETLRPLLKAEGYLTRDSRAKERKKFGRRKARRGHQWKKR